MLFKGATVLALASLPIVASAQMSSAEGQRRCQAQLDSQNRQCEGKPATGWNSRQACLDRNMDIYQRCVRNANVGNGTLPPRRP